MSFLIQCICLLVFTSTLFANDIAQSVIRIATTSQSYNPAQPWNKKAPSTTHGLATILDTHQVITTADMVANANFIQLETPNGEHLFPAKVSVVDYESNLALLTPIHAKDQKILEQRKGLSIANPARLGDTVDIVQIADNGAPIITRGYLQTVDILSSLMTGHYFLNYSIKASMQSASNSYTVPVVKEGKLLGILTSYTSSDQIVDIIAPEIITTFLKDAKDNDYVGFPSLGITTSRTTDIHFRNWLKLSDYTGGIYVEKVTANSSAEKAGIHPGDVLLSINGNQIDRKGYYQSKIYGPLFWTHLIRGTESTGSTVSIQILRDGKELQVDAILERPAKSIIPTEMYDMAPLYLVKGGFIFQELTQPYLQAFGENWQSRAPLTLLDALKHPEDYAKERNRIVFLSATLPTPATLGYENIRNIIVDEVNGIKIKDIPSLIQAFQQKPENGIHSIKVDGHPKTLYLDAKTSDQVDKQLLSRGLPALSRQNEQ